VELTYRLSRHPTESPSFGHSLIPVIAALRCLVPVSTSGSQARPPAEKMLRTLYLRAGIEIRNSLHRYILMKISYTRDIICLAWADRNPYQIGISVLIEGLRDVHGVNKRLQVNICSVVVECRISPSASSVRREVNFKATSLTHRKYAFEDRHASTEVMKAG
jgi:hypothetical protein